MLYRALPKSNGLEVSVISFLLSNKNITNDFLEQITLAYSQGITLFEIPLSVTTDLFKDSEQTKINLPDFFYSEKKAQFSCSIALLNQDKKLSVDFLQAELQSLLTYLDCDCIDFLRIVFPCDTEDEFNTSFSFFQTECIPLFLAAKANNKIKAIGFESENVPEQFQKLASLDIWDFCAFKLNYLAAYNSESKGSIGDSSCLERLELAQKAELGVFALNPTANGKLALPPREILNVFAKASVPRIPTEWALRWLLENQSIMTTELFMDSPDKVFVNCAFASAAFPNSLPQNQIDVVKEAAKKLLDLDQS